MARLVECNCGEKHEIDQDCWNCADELYVPSIDEETYNLLGKEI